MTPATIDAWIDRLADLGGGFPAFEASRTDVDRGPFVDPSTIAEDLGLLLIPVTTLDGIPRSVPIVIVNAEGMPELVTDRAGWATMSRAAWLVTPIIDGRRLRAWPRWVVIGWFRAVRPGLALQCVGLLAGYVALAKIPGEPAWPNLAIYLSLISVSAAAIGVGHAIAESRAAAWAEGVGWFARTALLWARLGGAGASASGDIKSGEEAEGPGNVHVTIESAVRTLTPACVAVVASTLTAIVVMLSIDPWAMPLVVAGPLVAGIALVLSVPSITHHAVKSQERANVGRAGLLNLLAQRLQAPGNTSTGDPAATVRRAAIETMRFNRQSRVRALPVIALAAAAPTLLVIAALWRSSGVAPGDRLALAAAMFAIGVSCAKLLVDGARVAAAAAPLGDAWRFLRDQPPIASGGRRAILDHELRYEGALFDAAAGRPPLDLTIRRGEGVHVIAQNLNLLEAFCRATLGLDPLHGGEILIDGANLTELDQRFLRRSVAMIPQDLRLPSGDLAQVAYVHSARNPQCASNLLAEFEVDAIVGRLPLGWATPVFEGGLWLDAADRFRILAVRALLKQPTLIVIDRAFDALPPDEIETLVDHLRQRSQFLIITSIKGEAFDPDLDQTRLDAVRSGAIGEGWP